MSLWRFNNSTKKLTENISTSEKFYLSSVEKLNNSWYFDSYLGKHWGRNFHCTINLSRIMKVLSCLSSGKLSWILSKPWKNSILPMIHRYWRRSKKLVEQTTQKMRTLLWRDWSFCWKRSAEAIIKNSLSAMKRQCIARRRRLMRMKVTSQMSFRSLKKKIRSIFLNLFHLGLLELLRSLTTQYHLWSSRTKNHYLSWSHSPTSAITLIVLLTKNLQRKRSFKSINANKKSYQSLSIHITLSSFCFRR